MRTRAPMARVRNGERTSASPERRENDGKKNTRKSPNTRSPTRPRSQSIAIAAGPCTGCTGTGGGVLRVVVPRTAAQLGTDDADGRVYLSERTIGAGLVHHDHVG